MSANSQHGKVIWIILDAITAKNNSYGMILHIHVLSLPLHCVYATRHEVHPKSAE